MGGRPAPGRTGDEAPAAAALCAVTSGTDAAGGTWSFAADGFASALVDTAALWALYLVLAWFGKHPPASLLHWFRSLGKSRQRRERSEMAQIIDLVSWFAAVAAVLLVMAFPDARSSGKELAIALLFAVSVAVGAVRLVGWILRGFFRA